MCPAVILRYTHVQYYLPGTKEQLQGAATGGGGGRGAKGMKRGPGKSELRKFKQVKLGEGMYCNFVSLHIAYMCPLLITIHYYVHNVHKLLTRAASQSCQTPVDTL